MDVNELAAIVNEFRLKDCGFSEVSMELYEEALEAFCGMDLKLAKEKLDAFEGSLDTGVVELPVEAEKFALSLGVSLEMEKLVRARAASGSAT